MHVNQQGLAPFCSVMPPGGSSGCSSAHSMCRVLLLLHQPLADTASVADFQGGHWRLVHVM